MSGRCLLGSVVALGELHVAEHVCSATVPKIFLSVLCILFKRSKSPLIRFVFVVGQRFDDDGRPFSGSLASACHFTCPCLPDRWARYLP